MINPVRAVVNGFCIQSIVFIVFLQMKATKINILVRECHGEMVDRREKRGMILPKGGKCMISENLLKFRKGKNMTQEALAEAVGVTRQTVAKWESGESIPDLDVSGRLAAALDISLDDLANAPADEMSPEPAMKGKHMFGMVTVGDKGQIVIPVRARRVFHINPGDQLMVLGDEGQGIALVDARLFMTFTEGMKNGF